jgi:hypothetical protein
MLFIIFCTELLELEFVDAQSLSLSFDSTFKHATTPFGPYCVKDLGICFDLGTITDCLLFFGITPGNGPETSIADILPPLEAVAVEEVLVDGTASIAARDCAAVHFLLGRERVGCDKEERTFAFPFVEVRILFTSCVGRNSSDDDSSRSST